jgi:hypothetical protein
MLSSPERLARQVFITAAAVVAVYVSSQNWRTIAQGSSAGTDQLYIQDESLTNPVTLSVYDRSSGTQSTPGQLQPANCRLARVKAAPDGTLYGFVICDETWQWGRLDPVTRVVTPLGATDVPAPWFNPEFLSQFGAPGSPIGYRLMTEAPDKKASSTFPLNLYAVDSLSPYREHLVYAGVQPGFSMNFGLGTIVDPDGSAVYWVTTDSVSKLPLNPPPADPEVAAVQFIKFLNIDSLAAVSRFDSTTIGKLNLIHSRNLYSIDSVNDEITVTDLATNRLATVLTVRQAPWGGVRIEPHTELVTSETGATATFTAVLTVQPTANVMLSFTSTDTGEGTVSPSSATFTTGNWDTPQTITVTGVADALTDGDQAYTITTSATSSADANYSGRTVLDVGVTNTHVNQVPALSPGTPSARQGSPAATANLGTASDPETAAGSLTVATQTVPSGVTVGTITNTSGTITAPLSAACSATTGARTLTLRVTDGNSGVTDQDVTVTVLANTVPGLGTYAATSLGVLGSTTVTPNAAPSDNGSAGLAVATPGFTGSLSVNDSTGTVTIGNAGPSGIHTITVTATDNCGATTVRTFDLTVTCPAPTLSPASAAFPVAGGSGSGDVTLPASCGWSASTPADWITLDTASGSGNGTLTYTVAVNATGSARAADITVGGQTLNVTQPARVAEEPIVAGVTRITLAHVADLRTRITTVRAARGLGEFGWADPVLIEGVTVARAQHLIDLRTAITQAYEAANLEAPSFTDPTLVPGVTFIRAVHFTELREMVAVLE